MYKSQIGGGTINKLPPTLSQRHILVLVSCQIDGRSQDEVATELGVSQQWVSQLLQQAERLLAEAGLAVPKTHVQPRTLSCPSHYLDRLQRCNSGRYKPSGTAGDEPYRPFN